MVLRYFAAILAPALLYPAAAAAAVATAIVIDVIQTLLPWPALLQSESTGTKTFSLFGPAGGGANLTAFHFETKVGGWMQHCTAVLLVNGDSVLADDGRSWLAFASAPRINSGLVKRLHCVDCLALSCSSSDVPGPFAAAALLQLRHWRLYCAAPGYHRNHAVSRHDASLLPHALTQPANTDSSPDLNGRNALPAAARCSGCTRRWRGGTPGTASCCRWSATLKRASHW